MPQGVKTDADNAANELLRREFNKMVTDVAALRDAFNAAVGKLNADAGVTDTDYAEAANATAAAVTVF